jgi:7-keto-8-aminopelargonate synthetase-like enzyme
MKNATDFAPAHLDIADIDRSIAEAATSKALMLRAGPSQYTGRHVDVEGEVVKNFGSCSYLGLELRPELQDGAVTALRRYGTQFPFARPLLECHLYDELHERLDAITGCKVLVAPSTTLAHVAALPVLIGSRDAVIVDQFAHASLHTGLALLKDTHVEPVRHNRVDVLASKIERLGRSHERVWYVLDGVYSMLGDFAPFAELAALLSQHPKLHLYVDDAHAMSWTGRQGRGRALEVLPELDRVVVALSLNKAFAAAGGALAFPSGEWRERVRRCGGPMLFSGSIQPPLLGAAVASARLHQTPELTELQQQLHQRILLVHDLAAELALPLGSPDLTPVCFLQLGPSDRTYELVRALRARGYYVAASMFPAVPLNRTGIRFTVSLHNPIEDIREFMAAMAMEIARIFGDRPPQTGNPEGRLVRG